MPHLNVLGLLGSYDSQAPRLRAARLLPARPRSLASPPRPTAFQAVGHTQRQPDGMAAPPFSCKEPTVISTGTS